MGSPPVLVACVMVALISIRRLVGVAAVRRKVCRNARAFVRMYVATCCICSGDSWAMGSESNSACSAVVCTAFALIAVKISLWCGDCCLMTSSLCIWICSIFCSCSSAFARAASNLVWDSLFISRRHLISFSKSIIWLRAYRFWFSHASSASCFSFSSLYPSLPMILSHKLANIEKLFTTGATSRAYCSSCCVASLSRWRMIFLRL